MFFESCLRKVSLHAVSRIVPKIQKVELIKSRNNKIGVGLKNGLR